MPDDLQVQDQGQPPVSPEGTPLIADTGTPPSPPSSVSGTGQPPSGFSYKEDRSKWIPPHRLTETSRKAQELATQLAESQRQIQALTNSRPAAPEEVETSSVREALFKVLPQLQKFSNLSDEQLDQLLQAPGLVQQHAQAEQERWDNHATVQMGRLSTLVAEAYGQENLTTEQREDMEEAFKRYVLGKYKNEMDTSGNSEIAKRYERGDEALFTEFKDRHVKTWLEPARRKLSAQEQSRQQRVPQSTGRNVPSTTKPPQSFKSLDERIDFAAKIAKERGMSFGR